MSGARSASSRCAAGRRRSRSPCGSCARNAQGSALDRILERLGGPDELRAHVGEWHASIFEDGRCRIRAEETGVEIFELDGQLVAATKHEGICHYVAWSATNEITTGDAVLPGGQN